MMVDLTQQGMGLRCKRFVCIIEGGMVTHTRVGDEVGPVSAAAVEKVLDVSHSTGPRNAVLFEKMLDQNGDPRTPDTAESTAETPDLLPVSPFLQFSNNRRLYCVATLVVSPTTLFLVFIDQQQ